MACQCGRFDFRCVGWAVAGGCCMTQLRAWSAIAAAAFAFSPLNSSQGQNAMLAPPGFHHLHLNSVDPDAAIDFYTRQFASTSKSSWGDIPALKSPNNVLVLFSKVDAPPPIKPQSALWHF